MHYRKYGPSPSSIIVLHGGPGAPGNMAQIAKRLSDTQGVLEPFLTGLSIQTQLIQIKQLIDETCSPPVKLIGHSWGAWLAYIFAANQADLINKLVMIGAGAFEHHYNSDITETRLARLAEKEKSEVLILAALVKEGKASDANFRRFGTLMSKADSFDCCDDGDEENIIYPEVYQAVWPEAEKMRKTGELLRMGTLITCPVVAIHGEHDPHPAAGVKEPLQRVLKDFRFVLIEKCGHYPWKERQAGKIFYDILKEEIR
jgi:pimeloyl-ACP methyl ester carboxylesterase